MKQKIMNNRKKQNNYAFIDSQNLNLAVRGCGWILDFKRFRKYLSDKYGIVKAYLFIGYLPGNESLYADVGVSSENRRWDSKALRRISEGASEA